MQATHDDSTFTLMSKAWSNTYPLDDLTKWLAFYRHQKEKFPKSLDAYDASIAALEGLADQLGIAT